MCKWHGEIKESGNTECNKCCKLQSSYFKKCIYCCNHNTLAFDEDYCAGWNLTVYCDDCGKNFDFSNKEIIANYKAVKR